MKELLYVRPSYETRGTHERVAYADAHRVARMALAVGVILELPALLTAAEDAITRVGSSSDDEVRYTHAEVERLAELATRMAAALLRTRYPHGEGGELVKREAAAPSSSSPARAASPRLPFFELLEQLATLELAVVEEAVSGIRTR